jgi:8-oxo-dGTP pyrophosphatase MutT (NUDIX family)
LTVAGLRELYRWLRAQQRRRIVAAVPVRRRAAGDLEFLIVRTRSGDRWTLPKGGCERGETLAQAAAREAVEEAGAAGRIGEQPVAEYRYGDDSVTAFLLEVEHDGLPAEPGRHPAWFGFEAACDKLAEGRTGASGAQMERVLLAAQRAAGG